MFESIRRARLQREGLSCGKTRRKHQEGDLFDEMRTHPAGTVGVYVLFFIGVVVLMRLGTRVEDGLPALTWLHALYAAAIGFALVAHERVVLRQEISDNGVLLLVLGTIFTHLALIVFTLDMSSGQSWGKTLKAVVLPHAFGPLVLSVILGRRIGLFGAIYATLLGVLVCVSVSAPTYMATSVIIGFTGVLLTKRVRRRNRLFMAGLYVGVVAMAYSLLLHEAAGVIMEEKIGRMVGLPLVIGIVTGMAVGGLLPVLESVFGVTTDVSWLELADLNHPLMRRLSIEAPGTYHHSLVVANLSEAAAENIGASAGMCRVCSYFHDIGKLSKPEYFIENMDPSANPHEDLTPRMSALVIIAHVKDGVDLAIKHNLNSRIIDVIEQHHGTSLAWFFYRQALDQKAEMERLVRQSKAKEDDVPQVSEETFRYPGPRPQYKESAIISLADAVESASRTLEKPNASRIETMIDEIVQARMVDGQLDECDLTIAELARIKASFAKTLLSMMHGRIKYQKAVESKPQAPVRDESKPLLAGDDETPSAASNKIVEASFAGSAAESTVKKSRSRKSPPASAA
ncbi:HDIG domain-containing metalloprotein [Prosthecobacter sp.]|uniref:HD family phosphohydrolase n=1 Tax=Prosthecobacter sp. TaxID=1965333 RepID=UPI002ABC0EAD|nr:HDIG domain-containing metalloprotein [Prosthecobacter sp.]MDZ4404837.1 HDIG domain-containing protein [Prosthecobacter sp.]